MSAEKDLAVQLIQLQLESGFSYGIHLEKRIVQLIGDVDVKMLKRLDAALTILEAISGKAITIVLNSGGGFAYEGLAIATRIRRSKCKVYIEAHGHVMSAATCILAAGTHRSISKFANLMFHESHGVVEGRTKDLKAEAAQAQFEEEQYCRLLAEFTETNIEQWKQLINRGVDTYISPEKAKEMGLVHEIF